MPRIGDHLKSFRGLYTHHGIYIGSSRVIHYSGLSDGIQSGPIEQVSLKKFCAGNDYVVVPHYERKYQRAESVRRAESRLGEDAYSVTGNNCEHFVNWCIDGDHTSGQVDKGTAAASGTMSTAAGIGSRAAVASAGSVAGLSGSGVMSGLASLGGVVGGGAVAGLGVLGGSGGLAAASLINDTVLKDDENLDCDERESRSVGRKATYAGAAAGTAGSIAAVSAAGSVAGLSGAGITSGLAAIGGSVGGGMAAGVAVTTAAPVAAAAAVGYGLYKAVKWFKG
ncbi:lecithin retinol acyltransferase family protein [Shewanella sp. MBTL60-007]|uniref:lecithin retinol acyltransferase family protein n=1 Tax=Shewanella sp. MBTL60-007 TaxID=2815911 RepID=UPI001BC63E31|nr:lecithin retinol acyltransferase family protein [Shewanella sp. MBTL60-007]GIU21972.1 hypothetical protein TUM3792_23450 [Shewanella sp. MBTL60-007]